MKRLLVFLYSFTFLLFCFVTLTYAQDFDYNRAYEDYVYNYNLYRSSHLDYISAKTEYLTYRTLASQTKALEATKTMVLNRAEALKTYLTASRMKLKETTGITNYDQNMYYLKLDNEVVWVSNHRTSIPSAGTLDDLIKTSQELEKRFPNMEILAYQTLAQIAIGKENIFRIKVNEQIAKIETKIGQIREAGEDTTILERWLIQAREKVARSEEKERSALNLLSTIKSSEKDKRKEWVKVQKAFEEENQYLKEAVSYLKEIIREIKRV